MLEKLTPEAMAMCDPCAYRDGKCLCTLGWITLPQQNIRAQEGCCIDAKPAVRVFVIGEWMFQRRGEP